MPATGIVLPVLDGIADLKTIRYFAHSQNSTLDNVYVNTEECPNGKLWIITYINIFWESGQIKDILLTYNDHANTIRGYLAVLSALEAGKPFILNGPIFLSANEHFQIRYRFNDTGTNFYFSMYGFELNYSG